MYTMVMYFNLFVTVILKSYKYDVIILVKGKRKGKIHPEAGDEGPEREQNYSFSLF